MNAIEHGNRTPDLDVDIEVAEPALLVGSPITAVTILMQRARYRGQARWRADYVGGSVLSLMVDESTEPGYGSPHCRTGHEPGRRSLMSDDEFRATLKPSEKGVVIELLGTVNRGAKEGMEAAYEEASKSPGEILLDFRNVDYINSTGIAVIVGVLAMARAEDRQVGAFGLSDHYKEVFEITVADFSTSTKTQQRGEEEDMPTTNLT
jgi:anti-anti-sigma factor